MRTGGRAILLAAMLALAGCDQHDTGAAMPAPQEVTSDSTSEFCGMGVTEHPGPKGQIFVADRKAPYWFSSVRDAIAFTRLPEEPKAITAIYVNDMGKATDWDRPEPGTWIDAKRAWFVIGSAKRGGMAAESEAVPFGDRAKAEAFVSANGGRIVRFQEVPDDYVFPTPDAGPASDHRHQQG